MLARTLACGDRGLLSLSPTKDPSKNAQAEAQIRQAKTAVRNFSEHVVMELSEA